MTRMRDDPPPPIAQQPVVDETTSGTTRLQEVQQALLTQKTMPSVIQKPLAQELRSAAQLNTPTNGDAMRTSGHLS